MGYLDDWKIKAGGLLLNLKDFMVKEGISSLYFCISAISLFPVLEAVTRGDIPSVYNFFVTIGGTLIVNQIQKLHDLGGTSELAAELESLARNNPKIIDELDAILKKLDILTIATEGLTEKDREWFTSTIQEEIKQNHSSIIYEQPTSLVQGNYSNGIVVGGDSQKSIMVVGSKNSIQYIINQANLFDSSYQKKLLAQQIEDYLEWIRDRCGTIELRGIKRDGRQVVQLDLEKVYVPLTADVSFQSGEISLKEILAQGDRLVITGGPGSGKTTVLLHIAYTLAKAIQTNDNLCAKELLGIDLEKEKTIKLKGLQKEIRTLGDKQIKDFGKIGVDFLPVFDDNQINPWDALRHSIEVVKEDPKKQEVFDSLLKRNKIDLTALMEERGLPLPIFVPLNAYADYRKNQIANNDATTKTLASFVSYYLIEKQSGFDLPKKFFENILKDGKSVILLLDGLDEVADEKERVLVREAIETLVTGRSYIKVVTTCRSAAYKDRTAIGKGFREIKVKALNFENISELIHLAYQCIFPGAESTAQEKANDLILSIRSLEEQRSKNIPHLLVNSPLLVRMLLIVHHSERKLPQQRAELYAKASDAMLLPEYNIDENVNEQIGKMVGGSLQNHRELLQYLAFNMHNRGFKDGREIEENDLRSILSKKTEYLDIVDDFISLTRTRGTLLEERLRIYRFLHLGFQEYLCARYIAENIRSDGGIDGIISFIENGHVEESWWRESLLLVIGYLSTNNPSSAELLIRKMIMRAQVGKLPPNIAIAEAEIAGSGLYEWVIANNSFKKEVMLNLLQLFKSDVFIHAASNIRITFGEMLGKLGDARFNDTFYHLLDEEQFGFIYIPSSQCFIGCTENNIDENSSIAIPEFYISKHPVTVAQFLDFIKDSNYRQYDHSIPDYSLNNPVTLVTWYDAIAYCKWLNKKLLSSSKLPYGIRNFLTSGGEVCLPSEVEWEKTARERPTDIALKNRQSIGFENIIPTQDAFAVGCFHEYPNDLGIQDLNINVIEWTRSLWGCNSDKPDFRYPYKFDDGRENLKAGKTMLRVIRGVSGLTSLSQRDDCCNRRGLSPNLWDEYTGFRVVITKIKRL